MQANDLIWFSHQARREVTDHILPFWSGPMKDHVSGGYYGRMSGENLLIQSAPKGGILNARILWTFSAAKNKLSNQDYLEEADYAFDYILSHFFDKEFGGTYWSLDHKGDPFETRKQIYSQAFFIYALTEYYIAGGNPLALENAVSLFHLIEKHSYDKSGKGYLEALDREWLPLEDMRLSMKDANEKKTMNTHLHILEAYTNLFRVYNDPLLAERLEGLIEIFLQFIINPSSSHLDLFFDENWKRKSNMISYGHDIECSWLLCEAAQVLGNSSLEKQTAEACAKIALAAAEGLQKDGSLIYEKDLLSGKSDFDRHWWPQAEAVVGFLNAYELTGVSRYLDDSFKCFQYILHNLVDPSNGEWFWSIRGDGSVNLTDDKAGFWKCPYHNSRMCFEVIRRVNL